MLGVVPLPLPFNLSKTVEGGFFFVGLQVGQLSISFASCSKSSVDKCGVPLNAMGPLSLSPTGKFVERCPVSYCLALSSFSSTFFKPSSYSKSNNYDELVILV